MTTEQHQKLKHDIELLSERAGTCVNPIDKEIMAKAAGHLLNYYYYISTELEE